jgi:hypothetical protein
MFGRSTVRSSLAEGLVLCIHSGSVTRRTETAEGLTCNQGGLKILATGFEMAEDSEHP